MLPPDRIRAPLPRVLWIELTSKCPYRCVFCSRSSLRGTGQHMDLALFRSILAGLEQPEIIRLNYSGESIHHPALIEAIGMAARTGACTELVSAFASLPPAKMEAFVASGLDRLTISLHTMDPVQFEEIYGFSSLASIERNISSFLSIRERRGDGKPSLDFAFVAMERNLDQLEAVAQYAQRIGLRELFVHPVIRRDPIPEPFERELDGGGLREAFRSALREAIAGVRERHPALIISPSSTELEEEVQLGAVSAPHPGELPAGARIVSCDQDPWESVHILAGGEVVPCEVQDRRVMGHLGRQSLREIWEGPLYREFRRDFQAARDPICRACPYKTACLESSPRSSLHAAEGMGSELLRGWHRGGDEQPIWSKREALAILSMPNGERRLRLRGLLPPAPGREENRLDILAGEGLLGSIRNASDAMMPIQATFELDAGPAGVLELRFLTSRAFRPRELEPGSRDGRALGFGLFELGVIGA